MQTLKLLVLFLVLIVPAAAQRSPSYEVEYKRGMQLMIEENYEKARAVLLPLTSEKFVNTYSPYAHYFAALANYRTQRYAESRLLLKQLMERYPTWPKINEAYYLYAAAGFAANEVEIAMEYLKKIADGNVKKDSQALEEYYINLVTDLTLLKRLYQQYPEDRLVALALVDLIQRSSTDKKDLELSDRLTNRYGVRSTKPVSAPNGGTKAVVAGNEFGQFQRKQLGAKGYFSVGVLFPFNLDDNTSARKRQRDNQFALDMYEGIRLAKNQLQTEGIIVNLFAYDIENEPNAMLDLLHNSSFGQMDAIIGPLYAETNRLAVSYANQVKIPILNPLATDRDLLNGNPYAFLIQPSLSLQAEKAAAFAKTEFKNKSAVIFYSPNRADSLLATQYAKALTAAGIEILAANRLSTNASEGFSTALTEALVKKAGHVFLASSSKTTGPALISTLERKRLDVPIVTKMDAFNFQESGKSQFSDRSLYFIAPDFVDDDKVEVRNFKLNYINKRNTLPSYYAYQGYDMMLFFGRILGKYQADFRRGLDLNAKVVGYTLSGFDYSQANENQRVPICKMVGGKLVIVE